MDSLQRVLMIERKFHFDWRVHNNSECESIEIEFKLQMLWRKRKFASNGFRFESQNATLFLDPLTLKIVYKEMGHRNLELFATII